MDSLGNYVSDSILDAIASVLIRCFIIGAIILTIWFIFSINGLPEWLIQICIELTSLTDEQIHIIHFVLLGVFKIQIFLIFLLPYFCIKLFLRKRTR